MKKMAPLAPKWYFGFVALIILGGLGQPVFAQTDTNTNDVLVPVQLGSPENVQGGPEPGCFDYYKFGSIEFNIQPLNTAVLPGGKIEFSGAVMNRNTYPVADGEVYVQIFRENSEYSEKVGSDLVDEFWGVENLAIAGNGEQNVSFTWRVPDGISAGTYFAALQFVVSKKFYLAGLPFSEGINGGVVHFTVGRGEHFTEVAFNKPTTIVNDVAYEARNFPPEINAGTPVTIKLVARNLSEDQVTAEISSKLYWWDSTTFDPQNEKRDSVSLKAHEEYPFTIQFQDLKAGSYVLESSIKNQAGVPALQRVRFVVNGENPQPRIAFMAPTQFPLEAGKLATMFACIHSPTNYPSGPTTISLSLKDEQGRVIDSVIKTGPITRDLQVLKHEFVPTKDYSTIKLTAESKDIKGNSIQTINIDYLADDFAPQRDILLAYENNSISASLLNEHGLPIDTQLAIQVTSPSQETVLFEPTFSGLVYKKELSLTEKGPYEATVFAPQYNLSKQIKFNPTAQASSNKVDPAVLLALLGIITLSAGGYYFIKRKRA